MKILNTVIKILSEEHGKKVIQWWKDQGVDTDGYRGSNLDYPYYGVDANGLFSNWDCKRILREKMNVIELPSELPKRGDRILVWDSSEKNAVEKIFITYIEGLKRPVVCVCGGEELIFENNAKVATTNWEHYKLIEPKVELTLDEIAKKFGIDVSRLKIIK